MEMELIHVLRLLRRWLKLIVSIVLVTVLVLLLRLRTADPVYRAQVKLQLTTPQSEDVAVFDQYRYVSLRDEMTVARNNFTEVLQSDEVRDKTISQLSLGGQDAKYGLEVESVRDADFVNVAVEARSSKLAAEIANSHVDAAIEYYGELRAKPTDAEKNLFAAQLREAEEELRAAESAFAGFKAQNGVASLEDELATYQQLLEQLQLERDQRLLEESVRHTDPVGEVDSLIAQHQQELDRLLALAPMYNVLEENARRARANYQRMLDAPGAEAQPDLAGQIRASEEEFRAAEGAFADFKTENGIASLETQLATYQRLLEVLQQERNRRLLEEPSRPDNPEGSSGSADPTADVDKLIVQREEELAQLVALEPMYKQLEDNAQQAREKYQHMQDKYTEAAIKAQAARAANFIQVVGPANPPSQPASNRKLIALAIAGSLGFGVLLAFLLEYISAFERPAPQGPVVVLPDGLLEGLVESQRAANALVVSARASLEASSSAGPDDVVELSSPAAAEAESEK